MNQLEFRLACPEDAPRVEAFNRRLVEAGETYHRLSVELPFRTMVHEENSPIKVEKLFCFDGEEIRGGVGVKRMMFLINGKFDEVAFCVYPLSEGIVNSSFGMVGLMIEKEIGHRYPLMYGLGGFREKREPFMQTPQAIKVPLHFSILRAYPFLRNITYLRKGKWMRRFFDLLALSGIGAMGLCLLRFVQTWCDRCPNTRNVVIERFDRWEEWADDIWRNAKDSYSMVGDRSKAALQSLYPKGHKHLIKLRFKASDTHRLIGWAVLTASRMRNHKYFGNMVLSAIVDMLAVPEDAHAVVSGALVASRQVNADLLVASHTDRRWNDAFKRAGMLPGKTKDFLTFSPELMKRFNPIEDYEDRFFFTRGDGHGPTSLWMTDYHSRPI